MAVAAAGTVEDGAPKAAASSPPLLQPHPEGSSGVLAAALALEDETGWSTSKTFKEDLARLCKATIFCERLAVLELGSHRGHTTAVLSHLFRQVLAVDSDATALEEARKAVEAYGRGNVILLHFDIYYDTWGLFSGNRFDVALVDAQHDAWSVHQDLVNVLSMNGMKWVFLHDYGGFGKHQALHVKNITDRFIDDGYLTCTPLGLLPDSMLTAASAAESPRAAGELVGLPGDDRLRHRGKWPHGPEGVACHVRRRWEPFHFADIFRGRTKGFLVYPVRAASSSLLSLPLELCQVPVGEEWATGRPEVTTSLTVQVLCHRPDLVGSCSESGGWGNACWLGVVRLEPKRRWLDEVASGELESVLEFSWRDGRPPWRVTFDEHLGGGIVIVEEGARWPGESPEERSRSGGGAREDQQGHAGNEPFVLVRQEALASLVAHRLALVNTYRTSGVRCRGRQVGVDEIPPVCL